METERVLTASLMCCVVIVCVHTEASQSGVPIVLGANGLPVSQLLIDGVRVTFMADTGHQVGESWSAALTAVNTLSLRSVYSAEQVSVGQNGGMAAAGGMSVRAGIRAGDGVQVVSGRVTVMQGADIFGKLTTDGTRLFHFIRNFFVQYFQAPSSSLIC